VRAHEIVLLVRLVLVLRRDPHDAVLASSSILAQALGTKLKGLPFTTDEILSGEVTEVTTALEESMEQRLRASDSLEHVDRRGDRCGDAVRLNLSSRRVVVTQRWDAVNVTEMESKSLARKRSHD
jgi:hypothetical protein